MSVTKAQRVGIWIIAVFMAVGTIGSFIIIVLANNNAQTDQAKLTELQTAYSKEYEAYQGKVATQGTELSEKYYGTFAQYESRPAAFDAASVTELATEDLVVGDGETITKESSFSAYYIGWNPTGKVFDSSFEGGALKSPIAVKPGGVIQGWTDGVDGMKVGGIRQLSIPSDLAYGEAGSGEDIPANTPIKFIVMIIPTPETITAPEIPQQLLNYYQKGRLN